MFITHMLTSLNMTRWKKDTTKFPVSVRTLTNRDGSESFDCSVPKPVFNLLGRPDKLEFRIIGKKVEVYGN